MGGMRRNYGEEGVIVRHFVPEMFVPLFPYFSVRAFEPAAGGGWGSGMCHMGWPMWGV